jgi:hypothetical protein
MSNQARFIGYYLIINHSCSELKKKVFRTAGKPIQKNNPQENRHNWESCSPKKAQVYIHFTTNAIACCWHPPPRTFDKETNFKNKY